MLKNLPIGIQDFRKLREGNNVYVDKTALLYRLITEGTYYFLSRPRRFGKSLMISTLAEIFEGNKELFEGLYIHDRIEWKKRPVIRIDFTSGSFKDVPLSALISSIIEKNASKYGVQLTNSDNRSKFGELIEKLHLKTNEKVAVLIDEYDKPIIDYLEDVEKAKENRETLRDFYGVIKPMDGHLEFVMLTGVTKFSKVSIFSELNNLYDITTHNDYGTLVGMTKEEIDINFDDYKKLTAKSLEISVEELDAKLKLWYDGYSWNNLERVYNPFSTLSFFGSREFKNYWFTTGTPTFLVNFIANKGLEAKDVERTEVDSIFFDKFDIENLDIISLMFQTGYLTIKEKDGDGFFHLGYPNEEVRRSFMGHLLTSYSSKEPSETGQITKNLLKAFRTNEMEKFVENINALFASIPHQIFIEKKEAYYHSIIYLVLKVTGVYIDCEVSTSKGRMDAVVQTDSFIHVIEFKMLPATSADALGQIKEKGYQERFKSDKRMKFMIGISFDPGKRQLTDIESEEF